MEISEWRRDSGIKITTGDQRKPVGIKKKKQWGNFQILGEENNEKKNDGKGHKMKQKYQLRKPWTPVTLYRFLRLTQHDKQLVKTVEKLFYFTSWTYSLKLTILLNVLFWNSKKSVSIIKWVVSFRSKRM